MKPFALSFLFVTLLLSACGQNKKEFTEKAVIVKADQTVKMEELGLEITNKGCGRAWMAEEGQPAYERANCDIAVKHKGSVIILTQKSYPVRVGDAEIFMEKMNPWGREEDGVPPGGCRLRVKKWKAD